ncbi:MAG: hypothetical protein U0T83_04785 [Bacteriovoracaceae bacterium]
MKRMVISVLFLVPTLGWSMLRPLLVNNLNASYENANGSANIAVLSYYSHSRGGQTTERDVRIDIEKHENELIVIKDGVETRLTNLPSIINTLTDFRAVGTTIDLKERSLNVNSRSLYLKSQTDEYTLNNFSGDCKAPNDIPGERELVQILDLCTINTAAKATDLTLPPNILQGYLQIFENGYENGGPEKLTNLRLKVVNHQFTLEGNAKRVITIGLKFTGRAEVLSAQNQLKVNLSTATVGGINIKDKLLRDLAAQNNPRVHVDGSNITIDLVSSAQPYEEQQSNLTF